jgi:excisionase family DNA binding protein
VIDIIPHNGGRREASALDDLDRLLTTTEIAALFRVGKRQPAEWVRQGRLQSIRTPGGHHRFSEAVIRRLLAEDQEAAEEVPA